MRVEADGGAILHEVSPGVDVEVKRVVHEEQPVRRLFPHDVVPIPVEILRGTATNGERAGVEQFL